VCGVVAVTELQSSNPDVDDVTATVRAASAPDGDGAVARASAAWPGWRQIAPAERAVLLRAFAATVDEHIGEPAELEVREAGHPVTQARQGAAAVRDVPLYFSAAPARTTGRAIPV